MSARTTAALLAMAGCLAGGLARAEPSLEEALAVTPYPAPPATPAQVLVRNATVWTQTAEGILDGTDVLIDKGKVKAVGRGLVAGPGALVIDGTGRHVTPGIIDAHSHSATEALDLNEGVNSISAEVRVADVLDPRSRDIYLQLAGGVTTAHVLHGSANAIGGQNALVKYRWGATQPSELLLDGAPPTIKFALGENPTQAAFRNGMPGEKLRYPATRMGVAALVQAAFAEAAQYRDEWRRYDALSKRARARTVPPRRDLRMEALVEVLEGRRLVHAHSYRADEILMLMRVAEESGIRIAAFQHVMEGYRVADEMVAHGAAASTFSDWWSFKAEAFDAIPYNAALMAERGVLTSLNSDNADLARRLNLEAAKTIRYGGLGRQQALDMVTTSPARQLGIDGRVGSIAAGMDADLVVWSGDPLSVYSVADLTFVDGRLRFSREADQAHRATVAAARARLATELGATTTGATVAAATPNPPAPPQRYRYAIDAPAGTVAITGATVHTMTGPAIAGGVVVFAGGRITAVGGPDTAIPAGAGRIDAAGKHLWPGLIHTNSVLGISEIDSVPGTVDVSETGDVNADAAVTPAVNAASRHFPVARSGGITHAVVVPSGGLIAGNTSLLRTSGWTWERMTAVDRQAVVLRWPEPVPPQYALFVGGQKSLADRKKESDERIAQLERLLDGAAAYGRAQVHAAKGGRPPEYDAQLEALQPVLRGERPLWATAREKHAIEAAVGLAAKRKLRLVITDGRDAGLVADLLARHQVPVVLTNIVGEPPRPDDPYDALYSMPAKLEAAGVTFAIASGTRTGGSANARHITLFAGIAAAHGLDREAAYRSITLYPARILGLDDVLGSIAPGKSASLVLTDGDLLEPATEVEQVWIDGERPSMDDDQKAFYRKWRARPKAP
ncbi:MAG: amidohydrolase family protein [Gammaproteobacteria bacterium]|nr:amidohydrolase family protein [Gammaproteobacteria bacterium]